MTGQGVREFVCILRLLERHSTPALTAVVKTALDLGAVSRDAIELILRAQTASECLATPLDPAMLPSRAFLDSPPPDLNLYDTLLAHPAIG